MKILFVLDNLGTGGAQRQLVNLALGLHNRGHHVSFFCYSKGDKLALPLKDMGISIFWDIKKKKYSLEVIKKLRNIIQSKHYDLVFSALNTPNFYSVLACSFPGRPRLVLSDRTFDRPGYIPLATKLVRYTFGVADHITMNSYSQREIFEKKYPWLRDSMSVIYNGYDLNYFCPPTKFPHNDPLRLLVIASVSRIKNGLCLIHALSVLRDEYNLTPTVSWAGQHVLHGDRYKYLCLMQNEITRNSLENQWNWLGQCENVLELYHQHDVLIHPSYVEGLPNVVCEALACARPVIVSNTLDHPRIVQDGTTGLLFDWCDPHDLAKQIARFAKMTQIERVEMGKKGREFAEHTFSLPKFVNQYEEIFESLVIL